MTDSKHSLWPTPTALLVAALTVTVSTGIPIKAHADEKSLANHQEKIEVRMEEEVSIKEEDSLYKQRAITLAKQYEATAKRVASQGGNPKPLLDAAAYFAGQSK